MWDRTPVPDDAAYASNWWRILVIDAALGLGTVAAGVVLALTWNPLAWGLVVLGGLYEWLVIKRIFKWRDLRRNRRGQG